ncbi:hypothetical protein Tco_1571563 [Tanacetum coccineum]
MDDEEDDEVIKDLYDDLNVNLGNDDTEMTDADQGASEQQNISKELGFNQVEEDAHVIITLVIEARKADEPVQSSSVSSDFTSKLLNLDNPSPTDNEIASLMETSTHHTTAIPKITSGFAITTPLPPPVSTLESQMSEFRQTNQFAEAVSSISGIVDTYLASKMKEAVDVAVQLQTNKLIEEAQAENQEFLSQVDSTMKIQGLRKRSLQATPNTLPNLNISLLASLPMQRSQVILLKIQTCNKIKSSSREIMMNNPLTRRLPKVTSSRNLSDLQLLILIGVRDDKLTFDLLRHGLVKQHVLKNLLLHLMSSMILRLISLHLS